MRAGRFRLPVPLLLRTRTVLWLLAAAACAPGPAPGTATAAPTTTILTVHVAGELNLLRPVLAACAEALPGGRLLVFENAVPDLPGADGELTLWFGEPPQGDLQAALLGYDEIVAVAAAGSDWDRLSEQEFRDLYAGAVDSMTAEVWVPQPGLAVRSVLDAWVEGAVYPPEAFLAPTIPAAVEAAAGNPGAVAVIPSAWMTAELKSIFTLGELPVLALTTRVPEGMVRELIGCLQFNSIYRE